MHISDFRELIIWQKGMSLVTDIYAILKTLPAREMFGLCDQLGRSSVSVPSNIAEGSGKSSIKEFIHYLYISRGSLNEVDTQIEICYNIKYLDYSQYQQMRNQIEELRKMLNKFISNLKSKL